MRRTIQNFALLSLALLICGTARGQVTGSLTTESLIGPAISAPKVDNQSKLPSMQAGASKSNDSGKGANTTNRNEPSQNNTAKVNAAPVSGAPDLSKVVAVYRVSANDVLDIRLTGLESRQSTLFTVSEDGKIDYPLVGELIMVVGLTPAEIAARVASKVRIYDQPKFDVTVREYSSHFVIVTGAVANPGSRSLHREAVPLFTLLSESEPTSDAISVSLIRRGGPTVEIKLTNQEGLATLVTSGDLIKVNRQAAKPVGFLYFGGQINAPGQKDFYDGVTLSQAVLVAGGIKSPQAHNARVFHRASDGRLLTTVYDLMQIDLGKMPDPELHAGDRIEIIP